MDVMCFQEIMERQRDEKIIIVCLDVMIPSVKNTGRAVLKCVQHRTSFILLSPTSDVIHLCVLNTGRDVSYCVLTPNVMCFQEMMERQRDERTIILFVDLHGHRLCLFLFFLTRVLMSMVLAVSH